MAEENKPLNFLEKINAPLNVLWNQYRLFFIGFGILILVVRFKDVIIDLLVANSKKTFDNAVKQDTILRNQETQYNNQANQLRNEANQLSENKPTVGEDWNLKK